MFSKEEAYQVRKKFWVSFGSFMKLQTSSAGEKINWLNYKTGIKDLYFKTNVDNKCAVISIEMHQKDSEIRELIFEQFEEFQPLFHSYFEKEWIWYPEFSDEGKLTSKIELKFENVSIFRESDWPEIIRFFKQNLLKLDEFWNDVKDTFEMFK
jgi:hypothetical protein